MGGVGGAGHKYEDHNFLSECIKNLVLVNVYITRRYRYSFHLHLAIINEILTWAST